MKKSFILSSFFACALAGFAQTEAIKIDLNKRGATVSPNLYGIFFEEISHAGDGGLYAELVQNRGFEEHVLPSSMTYENGRAVAVDSPNYEHGNNRKWSIPWDIEQKKMLGWEVKPFGGNVIYDVVKLDNPLHENTPHAMELKITTLQEGGKVILSNTGYWGMGLKSGEKYDLRFYVKSADYKGNITARISDGNHLGTISFKAKKIKDWTEFTGVLTSTGTTGKGQLLLEFDAPGTVYIDYVSLFPQNTFKGRKNGLRPDLVEMILGLQPKFMRWPGGCIVEGATYENRVKWKETLGDPMTRRGEWDVWGYRSTWGMGYHEFLQFCEDTGMDAMFVNNAGMSCSVRNGDYTHTTAGLDSVIQNFRDAIEYAIGDPEKSEWAKKRAEAGHPAPFPLKYVEIGNENVGPVYVKHFNYIFEKLNAEYPQLTFINTLGHTDPLLEQIPGEYMVDPHWYRDPNFFFNNNNLFDDAPRKHDIYVGEYACNAGVGSGNLLAAISEAAFILGMERNSDVVKMTSYAPLFENVNQPNWPCNLIHFNSNQTYGRASYYVQKMSAENRATYNVELSETSFAEKGKPFAAGTIGLGSYSTQCEYRNIQITTADGKTQKIAPSKFQHKRGQWNVNGDVIAQTSNENLTMTVLPEFSSDNYTLQLQAKKNNGKEGFFVYYGLDEQGRNGYVANVAGWNNITTAIQPVVRGRTIDVLGRQARQSVDTDRWYDIKVVVTPELVTLFVDGKEMTSAKPVSQPRHFCQTGYDELTGELIIKVVNGTDKTYTRGFEIEGTNNVAPEGKVITISGNAQEENNFEEPYKLVPVTTTFNGFAKQFSYEFAPMSYTILRIKARPSERRRFAQPTAMTEPDVHDPVIARGEDGRFYIFSTGMNVGVMSSSDLKEWKFEPSALSKTPEWAMDTVPGYRGHTWAPDISYHNGLWHLYYSCSTFGKNGSAIGLAVNKTLDPKSPDFKWEDKGMVIASHKGKDCWNAIDPNLIVDKKGTPYLTFGSFWDGIQLIELSKDDFKTPVSEPKTIARRFDREFTIDKIDFTQEGNNIIEAGPNAIEAPFIFKHGDYYYLFVSFDYCCRGENSTYKTVYGRSKKITGPFVDKEGKRMDKGGGTLLYGPNEKFFGVGHNAAFTYYGQPFFISHAYEKKYGSRAKLFIRPMNFDKDGWIIVTE